MDKNLANEQIDKIEGIVSNTLHALVGTGINIQQQQEYLDRLEAETRQWCEALRKNVNA